MARNIVYEATWYDKQDKYNDVYPLCFRHALLRALQNQTIIAQVDDGGVLGYSGCKDCEKENENLLG